MTICKLFLGLTVLIFSITLAIGQIDLVAVGHLITGSNGSVSISIGQVSHEQINGANGFIIQGVQQPIEVSRLNTSIIEKNELVGLLVYPNPTTNYINISLSGVQNPPTYQVDVCNNQGIKVYQKISQPGAQCEVDLSTFPSGIYILSITTLEWRKAFFRVSKI